MELFVTLNDNAVTSSQLLNEWFPEPAKFNSRLEGFLAALRLELGWSFAAIIERQLVEPQSASEKLTWCWTARSGAVPSPEAVDGLLGGLPKGTEPVGLALESDGAPPAVVWATNMERCVLPTGEHSHCNAVLLTSHQPTDATLTELLPSLVRVLCKSERNALAGGTALSKTCERRHDELRAVLAALPDAVVVVRDQCVHFANQAFFALCGRSAAEVIGAEIQTFVHAEDWSQFAAAMEHQSVFSARFQRADKAVRVVELSGAGVVAFEGAPSRVLVGRDVTENLLSREQYVRDDRLAALGSLAVGVAHEVNNPLAYVMLNLEMLQAEVQTRSAHEAISEALDGVRRIRRIVSELRGFWHGESRAGVSVVDVETAVTAATSLVQNEIRHRASLLRHLEPDLGVVAREGHLVQVLVNILLYAVHSIPDDSSEQHAIVVGSRSLGEDGAEITISDNGRGFAPDELSRMFDPFGVPRVPGDNTGLGLAITKRMVDELGGHIGVTSDGQRGSTFSVVLPRAPQTEANVESRRAPPDLLQVPFRVLVVDDEPLIVRAIKRVLNQCNVQTATDGGEAFALLANDQAFDVILCDLMMPRVSGPELFRRVSEQYPALLPAFVFMTGGAFSEWSRQFLQTAGCPVIAKPFDPVELRVCVEKTAVRLRRQRRG